MKKIKRKPTEFGNEFSIFWRNVCVAINDTPASTMKWFGLRSSSFELRLEGICLNDSLVEYVVRCMCVSVSERVCLSVGRRTFGHVVVHVWAAIRVYKQSGKRQPYGGIGTIHMRCHYGGCWSHNFERWCLLLFGRCCFFFFCFDFHSDSTLDVHLNRGTPRTNAVDVYFLSY